MQGMLGKRRLVTLLAAFFFLYINPVIRFDKNKTYMLYSCVGMSISFRQDPVGFTAGSGTFME